MAKKIVTEGELVATLRASAKARGGQHRLAKLLGVSDAYVSDILNERRGISVQIARKLGYERVYRQEVE